MALAEMTSLEVCAGAGGQALGLERAGFSSVASVEIEGAACDTLRLNRPAWAVLNQDIRNLSGLDYRGIDLFAAGVPCPPFSIAGKQLGADDERDLFPSALRIIQESKPTAVLLENVPGLASSRFSDYRRALAGKLTRWGYSVEWQILNACNYGVPQLRPRFVLVAIREKSAFNFEWPKPIASPPTVGEALGDLMGSRGWRGAGRWAVAASSIAPTLVGGSRKHGGADLGPTRARAAWRQLGVEGRSLSEAPPDSSFPIDGLPRLTLRMAARVQGFPDSWEFSGLKTAAYRQIGNAFPPPVAFAVGSAIRQALLGSGRQSVRQQPVLALRA